MSKRSWKPDPKIILLASVLLDRAAVRFMYQPFAISTFEAIEAFIKTVKLTIHEDSALYSARTTMYSVSRRSSVRGVAEGVPKVEW